MTDQKMFYQALITRDHRFDGIFFVGVTSTGIYCRPICPAKKPKAENCQFFPNPEMAENANFRPCLRCRPELAPGVAPIDDSSRIAEQLAHRLEEGLLDGVGVDTIASEFELSSRQIRRIIKAQFGVSPMDLVITRRLLLARQLLTQTQIPMYQVAQASGFSSVRRFNDAFARRHGMPPTRLRKVSRDQEALAPADEPLVVRLSYRPPYNWEALLHFLQGRELSGVETATGGAYRRTICVNGHAGWISVTHVPQKHGLAVELSPGLAPVLIPLIRQIRHAFDLSAQPEIIAKHLSNDHILGHLPEADPGLRVPGTFNGFEMAVRAILGQQITVKAATTISCRFAERFGEPIPTPFPALTRLSPTPERVAAASVDDIASLGIIRSRTNSIIALAKEVSAGRLKLEPGANPEATIASLVALPGIGQWTAQYIVMRALQWPDAFPKEDIVLRKQLGGVSAKQAEEVSQPWRPWRSYATMHLWHGAS